MRDDRTMMMSPEKWPLRRPFPMCALKRRLKDGEAVPTGCMFDMTFGILFHYKDVTMFVRDMGIHDIDPERFNRTAELADVDALVEEGWIVD